LCCQENDILEEATGERTMSDLDKQTPAANAAKLPPDLATAPLSTASSQIAAFTARRADVARSDHEEFQAYLQAKHG
jgi:hypothetical protein